MPSAKNKNEVAHGTWWAPSAKRQVREVRGRGPPARLLLGVGKAVAGHYRAPHAGHGAKHTPMKILRCRAHIARAVLTYSPRRAHIARAVLTPDHHELCSFLTTGFLPPRVQCSGRVHGGVPADLAGGQ
jgi:hypothetical protein